MRYGKTSQKIGQKYGFGAILGSILEAKMLQNQPKKYAKKRHSKKKPPGRLAAPFWTISRSFLGGFFVTKNGPGATSDRFFGEVRDSVNTLVFTIHSKGSSGLELTKNGAGGDLG